MWGWCVTSSSWAVRHSTCTQEHHNNKKGKNQQACPRLLTSTSIVSLRHHRFVFLAIAELVFPLKSPAGRSSECGLFFLSATVSRHAVSRKIRRRRLPAGSGNAMTPWKRHTWPGRCHFRGARMGWKPHACGCSRHARALLLKKSPLWNRSLLLPRPPVAAAPAPPRCLGIGPVSSHIAGEL